MQARLACEHGKHDPHDNCDGGRLIRLESETGEYWGGFAPDMPKYNSGKQKSYIQYWVWAPQEVVLQNDEEVPLDHSDRPGQTNYRFI